MPVGYLVSLDIHCLRNSKPLVSQIENLLFQNNKSAFLLQCLSWDCYQLCHLNGYAANHI